MAAKYFVLLGPLVILAACAESYSNPGNLPENVRAIAAPGQDLTTAFLKEADGCYWYRYTGPVETTDLPLRNIDGRPICARA